MHKTFENRTFIRTTKIFLYLDTDDTELSSQTIGDLCRLSPVPFFIVNCIYVIQWGKLGKMRFV